MIPLLLTEFFPCASPSTSLSIAEVGLLFAGIIVLFLLTRYVMKLKMKQALLKSKDLDVSIYATKDVLMQENSFNNSEDSTLPIPAGRQVSSVWVRVLVLVLCLVILFLQMMPQFSIL